MKPKSYSKSLKKMQKNDVYECSIQKIQNMKDQIDRSAQINLNPKIKQIKNYVLVRKQLIEHKSSNNKLQEEVDKILKDFVKKDIFELTNKKINQKNNYSRYRIQTDQDQNTLQKTNQYQRRNQNHMLENLNQEHQSQALKVQNEKSPSNKLPRIVKSSSQEKFQKLKSRKLKTEHEMVERLNKVETNPQFQYVNIDTAIRQYRAGMTSLISGVYYNPFNPYKKVSA